MTGYDEVPSIGTARIATSLSHHLAEGPMWDPFRGKILWVDIMAGAVHSGSLAHDGTIQVEDRFQFPDSAGAVAVSRDGELLVAGTHRLHRRRLDGSITSSVDLVDGDERRFNDGKPDPGGRFIVGTKGPGGELLLSVGEEITVLDDDLTLSNGLAWSADGRRLYSVDTLTRRIHVREYEPRDGSSGDRQIFVQLEHGHPDGLTIDTHDHLWVAMWGAGCVIRISPDGNIISRIDVPAPHTSCAAFAGPDLDTLVITTATEGLSPEEFAQFPLSGHLFTIKPGVSGLAPNLWDGAHGTPALFTEGPS